MEIRIRVLPLAVLCAVLVSGLGAGAPVVRGAGTGAGAGAGAGAYSPAPRGASAEAATPPAAANATLAPAIPASAAVASGDSPSSGPGITTAVSTITATAAAGTGDATSATVVTTAIAATPLTTAAPSASPPALPEATATPPDLPTVEGTPGTPQPARSPTPPPPTAGPRDQAAGHARRDALGAYGRLPLAFERNDGQVADGAVLFTAHGAGHALALTAGDALLSLTKPRGPAGHAGHDPRADDAVTPTAPLSASVVDVHLLGADPGVTVTGEDALPGTANYLIGTDPRAWRTGIPTYARVAYRGVYPGIDLVYYGTQGRLEYDFVVAPGADPSPIALQIRGARSPRLDKDGNLVLTTPSGDLVEHAPVAYQEIGGQRQDVAASFALSGTDTISFTLGAYDPTRPLVVDPVLGYSTYLGGNGTEEGNGIAVNGAGNAYVTGSTWAGNFPTTAGAYQTASGGHNDAFVTELNASGSGLVYSTYLGGGGYDTGYGLALDAAGAAYVVGSTAWDNAYGAFPTTAGAFQTTFPSTGANTPRSAFVAKLNASGSALVYSTFLGGSGYDEGGAIAVDASGAAYVTGRTTSLNFPTKNAYQGAFAGGNPSGTNSDAYVSKLTPSGSALAYSTYLGGSGDDTGYGIAVDAAGAAYVTGQTASTTFPTKNAYQGAYGGGAHNAFVSKVSPDGGSLGYGSYLGGSGDDTGYGIAVDGAGVVYVTGHAGSANFPILNAAQPTPGSGDDAFVAALNANALVYSGYLGGGGYDQGLAIAVDGVGNAYVTGQTSSSDFPTSTGAYSTTFTGGTSYGDAFVARVGTALTPGTITTVAGTGTAGYSGDGGAATSAPLNAPNSVAVDGAGNLYIADRLASVVRRVDPKTGVITTVAGTGVAGYGGDGAVATAAQLNRPAGVAVDGAGNLYIADTDNNRVRKVDAGTGLITTVAGNGVRTYGGDGGAATAASLTTPLAVAFDATGNLYIDDLDEGRIRKVDAVTGLISTVAGGGTCSGSCGDGGPATAAHFSGSYGLALDAAGNLYIADTNVCTVREVVAATGIITTVAGNGVGGYLSFPGQLTFDAAGNLFIANGGGNTIVELPAARGALVTVAGTGFSGYGGDGGPATGARFNGLNGVALDSAGNLYVGDTSNSRVRLVAAIAAPTLGHSGTVAWHARHGLSRGGALGASVDLSDGHLDLTASDLAIPARGPDLALGHTYDSAWARQGLTTAAGVGWQGSRTPRLGGLPGGTIVYQDEGGATWPFTATRALTATGPYTAYTTPPGLP